MTPIPISLVLPLVKNSFTFTPNSSRQIIFSKFFMHYVFLSKFSPVCFNDPNIFLVILTPNNITGFKSTSFCCLPFLLIYVEQVSRSRVTAYNETIYVPLNSLIQLQVMINEEHPHVQIIIYLTWLRTHSTFLASHVHLSSFIP